MNTKEILSIYKKELIKLRNKIDNIIIEIEDKLVN